MLDIEVFWSVRSPYSYLVTPRLFALAGSYAVNVRVRPVYPHAVRDRSLAASRGDAWLNYFKTDIVRTAAFLEVPMAWPRPDPVDVDPATGAAREHQPRVSFLTHLIEAAEQAGCGLAFIHHLTQLLWNPQSPPWTQPGLIEGVLERAGLNATSVLARVQSDGPQLEAAVIEHDRQQKVAGHWGVPLMVFKDEPFFGQDRFDQLVWRLNQSGLSPRQAGSD